MPKMAVRDVDTGRVIEEVRKRKWLWDPTDQRYKNKEERNKAWQEIVNTLFGDISEIDKQQMGRLIQQRWKTARDAFSKSKAAMKNHKKFKRYLFYDDLLFLDRSADELDESLKSSPPDSVVCPEFVESSEEVASPEITGSSENTQYAADSGSQLIWTPTRTNQQEQTNEEGSQFEREWISLVANQSPDLAPDDLAFFFSLGPILGNFDLEQKIEFRARVMREAMEMLRNPL